MSRDIYSNVLRKPFIDQETILHIGQNGFAGYAVDLPSDDCNSVVESGVYKTKIATLNCPSTVIDTTYGILWALPVTAMQQYQMYFDPAGNGVYFRTRINGSYNQWEKLSLLGDQGTFDEITSNKITLKDPSEPTFIATIYALNDPNSRMLSIRTGAEGTTGSVRIDIQGEDGTADENQIRFEIGSVDIPLQVSEQGVGLSSATVDEMSGDELSIVNKKYIDPIVILPPQTGTSYTSGTYDMPTGYEVTDFRRIEATFNPASSSNNLIGYSMLAEEHHIDTYPDNLVIQTTDGNGGSSGDFARVRWLTPTTFKVERDNAGAVKMVVGWLKWDRE